jgi:hypothetical protein
MQLVAATISRAAEKPKSQSPNPKEIARLKLPGIWVLEFGVSPAP